MIYFGNTQPNPLESKVWLQTNGQLKTYNSHAKQWGNGTAPQDPWKNIANGVYAINKNWEPVSLDNADESCIAVALICDEYRFMIEKNEYNNSVYNELIGFRWGPSTNIGAIVNHSTADGENSSITLDKTVSYDFTTWSNGALSEFNAEGINNSAALIEKTTEITNISGVLNAFNLTTDGQNQNKSDWYIPACGQLTMIYLNMDEINRVLTKINGKTLDSAGYWSSSEYDMLFAWNVDFTNGHVSTNKSKGVKLQLRFVRDI